MDSVEMHIDFRVKFNKVNSNKNKGFLVQEIDLFLNDAFDKFVDVVCSPKSNFKAEGFEDSARRLDDIRTIVREATTDSDDAVDKELLTFIPFKYGKAVKFPNNYRRFISSWCDTEDVCAVNGLVPIRVYGSDDVRIALKDAFHRTHPKSPVGEVIDDILRVYEDGFTVSHVNLSYVYSYPKIEYNVQDCVLPPDVHRRIVDRAVNKVNAVINTDNYEKYINEITKNE